MGEDLHRLEIEPVERWASRSADQLAAAVEESLIERGRCLLALSGGSTPGPVLAELATRDIDWKRVTVTQVDERLAPAGSPARNFTGLLEAFDGLPVAWLPLPVDKLIPSGGTGAGYDQPDPNDGDGDGGAVEITAGHLGSVLSEFSRRLVELADEPPMVDVVQLGLGQDGHTASLLAGDPAVMELRRYVVMTGAYQGFARLTMTRPVLDRARSVIWLVRGLDKAEPLGRLLTGDLSIPAGLIRPRRSLIMADADAARQR